MKKEQYQPLVVEGIQRHPQVKLVDAEMVAITTKYDDYEEWSQEDQAAICRLEMKYGEAVQLAREELERFWARVQPGGRFVHRRYITEARKPVVCVITKIAYCRHGEPDMIHYRLDEGNGMRTKCRPDYFAEQTFGDWCE